MSPPPNWEPWTRQELESDLDFALFQQFLHLPTPRSLRSFTKSGGGQFTNSQIESIAHRCFWDERARFWDEHLDRIRRTTIEDVTKETAEQVARRQLRLLTSMQELGGLEIEKLVRISKENDAPGVVSARDALRLVALGIRFERLVRGETTEKIEQGPDMSALSVEDLRKIRELQEKAGVR